MINNNNLKQLKVLLVMQHKEEPLKQKENKRPEKVKDENQVQRRKNIIVEIVMKTIKFNHQVPPWRSILIIIFNNPIHHNNIPNNQIIMENIKMNYLLN
jgi:hypothetical protein